MSRQWPPKPASTHCIFPVHSRCADSALSSSARPVFSKTACPQAQLRQRFAALRHALVMRLRYVHSVEVALRLFGVDDGHRENQKKQRLTGRRPFNLCTRCSPSLRCSTAQSPLVNSREFLRTVSATSKQLAVPSPVLSDVGSFKVLQRYSRVQFLPGPLLIRPAECLPFELWSRYWIRYLSRT